METTMSEHGKMKKKAKTGRRKCKAFEVKESIKAFFPPTSPMGFGTPVPYDQPEPVELRKPPKENVRYGPVSFALPLTATE
jgi:hypothetical protein